MVMGPFSELHGFKSQCEACWSHPSLAEGVCGQPWEMPQVRLCRCCRHSGCFSRASTGKDKLVKSQLLPGRVRLVTELVTPRSPHPATQPPAAAVPALTLLPGFLHIAACVAPPHGSPLLETACDNTLGRGHHPYKPEWPQWWTHHAWTHSQDASSSDTLGDGGCVLRSFP